MLKAKLFLVSIASLLLVSNLGAQITLIPDVNFEKALIDLEIDSDGEINGSVLTSDIQQVTSLGVSGRAIASLTGIQDFELLQVLECQNNVLTSINIAENTGLEVLDCSSNQLSRLSVVSNEKLKSLKCSQNSIAEIKVSDNTNLETLYIDNNLIMTLNVKSNPNLKALDCSHNQLSVLNITYNWFLKYLDISFNNLDLISLINGVNLEYLNVSSNPLTTLNLISLTNLKTMHMVNNDLLPLIYFDNNRKLEYVSCHDNDILSTIKVKGADALKYLNCSNNNLNELDLSENLLLENLYCQNNQLSSLDLSLNTKLAFLKCHDNALEYLNIKNGQNILMTGGDTEYEGKIIYMEGMNATNNLMLQCIDVDNQEDANSGSAPYDSWLKDLNTAYSEDCSSFLGVDDYLLASGIKLFPNPSSEFISISSEQQNIEQVTFFSVLGNKVLEIDSGFESIDTKNLNTGIFLVRIRVDNWFVLKRYLKN